MHSVAYSPCTISRFQGISPIISSTGAGYVAISLVVHEGARTEKLPSVVYIEIVLGMRAASHSAAGPLCPSKCAFRWCDRPWPKIISGLANRFMRYFINGDFIWGKKGLYFLGTISMLRPGCNSDKTLQSTGEALKTIGAMMSISLTFDVAFCH